MKPGPLLSLKSPMLAAACASAAMSSGASYVSSGLLALNAAHSAARCFFARPQASARDSGVVLLLPALLASGPAGLKKVGTQGVDEHSPAQQEHCQHPCHSRHSPLEVQSSPRTSCDIRALKLLLLGRCEPLLPWLRDCEERVSLPGDRLPPA
jgi:hypothetical protein